METSTIIILILLGILVFAYFQPNLVNDLEKQGVAKTQSLVSQVMNHNNPQTTIVQNNSVTYVKQP